MAQDDGTTTCSAVEIGERARDFFSTLFTAYPYFLDHNLFDIIPSSVSGQENEDFAAIPSDEEIYEAITLMNPLSALGKDGFTGHFYRISWDVIKQDLVSFIIDFFMGAYLPKEAVDTTLILIPKITKARHLGDFRPISLGNFSSKIISKILAI